MTTKPKVDNDALTALAHLATIAATHVAAGDPHELVVPMRVCPLLPGESELAGVRTIEAIRVLEFLVHERGDAVRLWPVHALQETWNPGEAVEQVTNAGSGSNPRRVYRPGVVERIDRTYGYHETLVVRFDDGEVRGINPDVMRHKR